MSEQTPGATSAEAAPVVPTPVVETTPAVPAPVTDPPSPARRSSGTRRFLAIAALVLACLAILTSTVAVWTHQVALNTNRFTALVTDVASEPALIEPVSSRVSTRVVDALGVEARIAETLPGPTKALAPALTIAIRDAIDRRLQVALADPRVQAGLVKTLSFTHQRVVNVLRNDVDAMTIEDGYVYVDVWTIVGTALAELQSIGLIPADVQLPDLSTGEPPAILSGRLATALGVTLPADFGTIKLMPADRLVAAQRYVRIFDITVIVLLIVTVLLVVLALWLAQNRRWMLVGLGVGTFIAFLLARFSIGMIRDAVVEGVADPDVARALRSVADAVLDDLRGLTVIVLVGAAILAIASFAWGWRSRLRPSATAGASE